jgi:hypothetical protein
MKTDLVPVFVSLSIDSYSRSFYNFYYKNNYFFIYSYTILNITLKDIIIITSNAGKVMSAVVYSILLAFS